MSQGDGGCEREIQREAQRILPALMRGRLEKRGRDFVVTVRGALQARGRRRLSAAMTERFAARGWIARAGEGVYQLAPDSTA